MSRELEEVLVVVITYGHTIGDLEIALRPALALQLEGYPVRVASVDDSSGNAPHLAGTERYVTESNRGYSSTVNYIAQELSKKAKRIVLINPDAEVSQETLKALAWPDDDLDIIVPRIVQGDYLENVRSIYNVRDALLQTIVGRLTTQKMMSRDHDVQRFDLGSPWIPTGTVASFRTQFLRENTLREEMFWIEMSALSRDIAHPASVGIVSQLAKHAGHSSSRHASAVVSASLLHARASFVREYGTQIQTNILPFCVLAGISVKIVTRQWSLQQSRKMWAIFKGESTWQSINQAS